ncbi:diguanylate cyclase domain-containing protein [Persephonella sp.]
MNFFNDPYGYHVGDMVLVRTSEIIKSIIRKNDIFCRCGRERFLGLIRKVQHFSRCIVHTCILFNYIIELIPILLRFAFALSIVSLYSVSGSESATIPLPT